MVFQKEKALDWPRIQHLLKLGTFASVMVLIGDMLLGWGVGNPSVAELPTVFTRYLSVSDGRIFASALLGLIGIPIECLCWFAIYRIDVSPGNGIVFRPLAPRLETKLYLVWKKYQTHTPIAERFLAHIRNTFLSGQDTI